jgi:alpha-glucosidase
MKLAIESADNGEPVISNLEYYFPGQGFENINDQFMLGENLLVAPMVIPGYSREVVLPKGRWISDEGIRYKGGKSYTIDVPVDRIPYFDRIR